MEAILNRLLDETEVRQRADARRALRGENSFMTPTEAAEHLYRLGWNAKRVSHEINRSFEVK